VKVPEEYDPVVVDGYKALTLMSYLFPIKRGKKKGNAKLMVGLNYFMRYKK
jgi:hypothetical protein